MKRKLLNQYITAYKIKHRNQPLVFIDYIFNDYDFALLNLEGAIFENCLLNKCRFNAADLTDARFIHCYLSDCTFANAKTEGMVQEVGQQMPYGLILFEADSFLPTQEEVERLVYKRAVSEDTINLYPDEDDESYGCADPFTDPAKLLPRSPAGCWSLNPVNKVMMFHPKEPEVLAPDSDNDENVFKLEL
jgi:hypothetical protein